MPKWAFRCLVFGVAIGLSVTEMFAVLALNRAFGIRIGRYLIGGSTYLNLIVAYLIVDRLLLMPLGYSRSGKTVEVRARTQLIAEGEVDDDEVVEVHCAPSVLVGFGVMFLAFALGIALIVVLTPPDKINGIEAAYGLIAGCGLVGASCLAAWRWAKPRAWANATGITGRPFRFDARRRFVPWSKVATCEIETYYDPLGAPAFIRPTLKGSDGETLLLLDLTATNISDQQRLVEYIKAKLPKPKDDLFD
jgi:hypothetical protein